jgi:hypothetical protein
MNDQLAAKMGKIQGLLRAAEATDRTADREPDPEAAEGYRKSAANYRATAEAIIRKYRQDEEEAIAVDQFAVVPVMHSMLGYDTDSEFYSCYRMMMHWIADHCGIEYVIRYNRDDEDPGSWWFDLFGYELDLRMAELMWSEARLVFGSHLEPQVDPSLGDQVNAYNLRQAGILRKDIAKRLWGENTPANRSRAQRLYLAECKVRGEQPLLTGLGSDAEMYRSSYAEGFVSRLSDRLRAARNAVDSTGGVVVLHGRAERVKEAKYQAYPRLRPMSASELAKREEDRANLPAPKVDGRRKGWTKADERAYQRRNNASAYAGRQAGTIAAGKVQIDRNNPQAQRVDPAPQRSLEG